MTNYHRIRILRRRYTCVKEIVYSDKLRFSQSGDGCGPRAQIRVIGMGQGGCTIQFTFEDGGERLVRVSRGESILDAARKARVAIDAPCSGNGSCGKCRVRLLSGELQSEASRHIDADAYKDGLRLACASFA